mmetsp:Transcript_12779/g.31323  ORF Transcript_12779/g.31323 Transcript_12779/m.31323 type:complete len:229 (+) Transcript_12779:753-1439(+)
MPPSPAARVPPMQPPYSLPTHPPLPSLSWTMHGAPPLPAWRTRPWGGCWACRAWAMRPGTWPLAPCCPPPPSTCCACWGWCRGSKGRLRREAAGRARHSSRPRACTGATTLTSWCGGRRPPSWSGPPARVPCTCCAQTPSSTRSPASSTASRSSAPQHPGRGRRPAAPAARARPQRLRPRCTGTCTPWLLSRQRPLWRGWWRLHVASTSTWCTSPRSHTSRSAPWCPT